MDNSSYIYDIPKDVPLRRVGSRIYIASKTYSPEENRKSYHKNDYINNHDLRHKDDNNYNPVKYITREIPVNYGYENRKNRNTPSFKNEINVSCSDKSTIITSHGPVSIIKTYHKNNLAPELLNPLPPVKHVSRVFFGNSKSCTQIFNDKIVPSSNNTQNTYSRTSKLCHSHSMRHSHSNINNISSNSTPFVNRPLRRSYSSANEIHKLQTPLPRPKLIDKNQNSIERNMNERRNHKNNKCNNSICSKSIEFEQNINNQTDSHNQNNWTSHNATEYSYPSLQSNSRDENIIKPHQWNNKEPETNISDDHLYTRLQSKEEKLISRDSLPDVVSNDGVHHIRIKINKAQACGYEINNNEYNEETLINNCMTSGTTSNSVTYRTITGNNSIDYNHAPRLYRPSYHRRR